MTVQMQLNKDETNERSKPNGEKNYKTSALHKGNWGNLEMEAIAFPLGRAHQLVVK